MAAKIGQILRGAKVIDEAKLKEALTYCKNNEGVRTGEALVELGYADEKIVTKALAKQHTMPFVDLEKVVDKIPDELFSKLPPEVVEEYRIIPVQLQGNRLTVATNEPIDLHVLDALRFQLNLEVSAAFATKSAIAKVIEERYEEKKTEFSEIYEADDVGVRDHSIGDVDEEDTEDSQLIKLVNMIVTEAIKMRASDIHVEPMEKKLRLRYRIDGVCQEVDPPPKRLQGPILARMKIMAEMDIAERRKCQDGRIRMQFEKRDIDLRVSLLPATYGESIVMRILDKESALVDLDQLGFHPADVQRFNSIIKRPNGIFLVTGPTGSGKTTTLYAALKELNQSDVKIITAENPVEYNIAGLNQCQVNHKIGLNFARILRAMLRQAPNIILVGEIRDKETADIAIQAALTGHLVFSTLHTNDAPGALTRLIDMGVKPFLVASAVQAVMAQRLVRKLCTHCKEAYRPTDTELRMIGVQPSDLEGRNVYRAVGCEECSSKGYRGRVAVFELLEMSPELRDLAFNRASTLKIRAEARASGGMLTLQEDGIRKFLEGVTTIEEILRVTHRDDL